jgi:hypothetical protein
MVKIALNKVCRFQHLHTPCPQGYFAQYVWAKEMMKTHEQVMCNACERYVIWVPKKIKGPDGKPLVARKNGHQQAFK